jgi:hypothetical protein
MKLRPRFRLKTLLVLMTALAVWLGIWMRQVHERRELVARIEGMGGTVAFEHQQPSARGAQAAGSPRAGWLRWLDQETCNDVSQVTLRGATVTNADLRRLVAFQRLESLEVHATRVTPEGLRPLQQLPRLRFLFLSGLAADDEGMTELAGLKNLEFLWLDGEGGSLVGDAGLLELQALPKLRRVELGNARIGRDAMAAFQKSLPKCKVGFQPNGGIVIE